MAKSDRQTVPEGVVSKEGADPSVISQETHAPPLHVTPRMVLSKDELLLLALDHREGFLLSLIDGCTTVEQLCEIGAMPRQKVLLLLGRWQAIGIIALDDAADESRRSG